ncbi:MAG: hypothetical protein AB1918_03595 [Pseudomonadota bacterium]
MSGAMAKWCGWLEDLGDPRDFAQLRAILLCAVGRGCAQSDPCSERARDLILHAARKEPEEDGGGQA